MRLSYTVRVPDADIFGILWVPLSSRARALHRVAARLRAEFPDWTEVLVEVRDEAA